MSDGVAFNHITIGAQTVGAWQNRNFAIEAATLTNLSVAVSAGSLLIPTVSVHAGITPPGDEATEIYTVLCQGLLSQRDGLIWSGSLRLRDLTYITLAFYPIWPCFLFLTWTTSS